MLQVDDPIASLGFGRTRSMHLQLEPHFSSLNESPQWMSALPDFEAGGRTYYVSIAPCVMPI